MILFLNGFSDTFRNYMMWHVMLRMKLVFISAEKLTVEDLVVNRVLSVH